MDRKTSDTFATPRFTYGQVETALGVVFNLDAARQRGALRGRLKHLQRLGLGVAAGKGARVHYSTEDAHRWLLALLLSEVGFDPTLIVEAVKGNWKNLAPSIKAATDLAMVRVNNPMFVELEPRVMKGSWGEAPSLRIAMFRRFEILVAPLPLKPAGSQIDLLPDRIGNHDWKCFLNYSQPATHLESLLR